MSEHERDLRLEEFKLLIAIGRDYFGFYLKAVVLYFAVMGIVLKLFVDADAGSTARLVAFLCGLVASGGAIAGTLVTLPAYKTIGERCAEVAASLRVPDVYFPATLKTAKLFLFALVAICGAWLLLLTVL